LAQMEGLPCRRASRAVVPPVAVPPDRTALGHDDKRVAEQIQLLDVGLPSPAVVAVAAAMQEIEHRPALTLPTILPTVRSQQPHLGRAVKGRGPDSPGHTVSASTFL